MVPRPGRRVGQEGGQCGGQASTRRYDREEDVGRVLLIDEYRVSGDLEASVAAHRLAGIGVDVEAREVAAGDVQPDAVAGLEQVACRGQGNGYRVDLAGRHHDCHTS